MEHGIVHTRKNQGFHPAIFWAFAILVVLGLPLTFYKPAIDPTLAPRVAYLALVITGLLFAVILTDGPWMNLKRLYGISPLLFYSAYILVSLFSLVFAENLNEGIFPLMRQWVILGLLILCVHVLLYSKSIFPFVLANLLLAFVLGMIGVQQYISYVWGQSDLLAIYDVVGIWGHKNILSGMLFLVLPLLIYAFFFESRLLSVVSACLIFVDIVNLFLLQTRSNWLSIIVLFGVIGVFSYLGYKGKKRGNRKVINPALRLMSLLLLAVLASYSVTRMSLGEAERKEEINPSTDLLSIEKRFSSMFDANTTTGQTRLAIWAYTLDMIQDRPITGVGVGNWKVQIRKYYEPDYMTDQYYNWRRPHNDYLQAFAETGIIGLLLFIGFFISLAVMGIRFIRKELPFKEKFLVIIAMGAIAGFAVDGLFAFPNERVDLQMMMMVYAAIIIAYHSRHSRIRPGIQQNRTVKYLVLGGLIISLLFCTYGSLRVVQAEVAARKALNEIRHGNNQKAVEIIDNGYNAFRQVDPLNNPLMWVRGKARSNMNEFNLAEQDLLLANQQMPENILVITELGMLYGKMGNISKAIGMFQQALKQFPHHIEARYNLGIAYYNLGNYTEALDHLIFARDKTGSKVIEEMIAQVEEKQRQAQQ